MLAQAGGVLIKAIGWGQHTRFLLAALFLFALGVPGGGTAAAEREVSPAKGQVLDPGLVAKLYHDATKVESIRGLLGVRGGKLIAERYYKGGPLTERTTVRPTWLRYRSRTIPMLGWKAS